MEKEINSLISQLQARVQTIRDEEALYVEVNFEKRAEAIDVLEFHILDTIEGLFQKEYRNEDLKLLKVQVDLLKEKLENIDKKLFLRLHEELRKSTDKKLIFRQIIFDYLEDCIGKIGQSVKIGYDNFDVFVNNLLPAFNGINPEAIITGEPEMVFYQKTPARIVFEMGELIGTESKDVFFDLGSGLGQVVILLYLLTGITAKGVEFEPEYFDYANKCALQFNLSNVEFINEDARNLDYSEATIFFLYTPFKGKMLQDMMNGLQKVAKKKSIRIFTYGPCSIQVARQDWLQCTTGNANDLYQLCGFKGLPY